MDFMANRPYTCWLVSPATICQSLFIRSPPPPPTCCMQGQLPTVGREIFVKTWDDLPSAVASFWKSAVSQRQWGRHLGEVWGGVSRASLPLPGMTHLFPCQHPHQQSPTSPLGPLNCSVDWRPLSAARNASIPASVGEVDSQHKARTTLIIIWI